MSDKILSLANTSALVKPSGIYFGSEFLDEVWFKDNAGLSPAESTRYLDVSHRTGRLMCYYVPTQRETNISRSTLQSVAELGKTTASVKNILNKFDETIRTKLKRIDRGYIGDKPNREDWANLLDDDEDFRDEFQKKYNNSDIHEAGKYTPEVLEDMHLNM